MPRPWTCPDCGASVPYNRKNDHQCDDASGEAAADSGPVDDQPTPRKPRPKQHAPRGGGSSAPPRMPTMPVRAQIQFVYSFAGDALAPRAPMASVAIKRQSAACAEAWDEFLDRFPAAKEFLAKGAIAGDILKLFMAHYPILQAVREEMAQRQREAEMYDGGLGAPLSAVG